MKTKLHDRSTEDIKRIVLWYNFRQPRRKLYHFVLRGAFSYKGLDLEQWCIPQDIEGTGLELYRDVRDRLLNGAKIGTPHDIMRESINILLYPHYNEEELHRLLADLIQWNSDLELNDYKELFPFYLRKQFFTLRPIQFAYKVMRAVLTEA